MTDSTPPPVSTTPSDALPPTGSVPPKRSLPPPHLSRRRFWLVLLLLVMGTCGVEQAAREVRDVPLPESTATQTSESRAARAFAEALWQDPRRRPLAAANLVVSLMLVSAALGLALRFRQAPWWARQALLANALWVSASTLSQAQHLQARQAEFQAILQESLTQIDAKRLQGVSIEELGRQLFVFALAMLAVLLVLRVAAHVALWRATRPLETTDPPAHNA